jgi:hypothetical protein
MSLTNNVTVTGTGLYASNTRESYFLKESPGYASNVDPRLPNYDYITSNLTIWANAQIVVSNISLFPDPGEITANSTVIADSLLSNLLLVPVSSTSSVVLGRRIITANIANTANVKVSRIFSANGNILLSGYTNNAQITSGETIYFWPRTQVGAVRVRGEVIQYDHAWTSNSSLTGLIRNVGGTTNSTINGNIWGGNIISVLGLRTLNS